MAQSGLSVGDVIDKLTGNFDEFGRGMQKVNEEAAKTSGQEIANMEALVSVAQDDTLSREKRLIAVKELQKEFPAYFGNLNTEKILNGDLTSVTKDLTSAIIERAKASAFASKIGQLAEQELKLNNRLANEVASIAKSYSLSKEEASNFKDEVLKGADVFKLLEPFKKRVGIFDLTGAVASSNAIKNIRLELIQNEAWQKKYTSAIKESTKASVDLNKEATKVKKVKPKKVEFEETFIAPFVSTISGLGDTMAGFEERTKTAFYLASSYVKDYTDEMKQVLIDFDAAVNDLITNSIANTFSNLGAAIGDALATGGDVLSAIGTTIIQAFAGFLSDMGDLLIKYGTLAVVKGKLDLAIAAGGPISIGAGIAAIAVGVALKAAAGALGSFASSGGAKGGGGAGANNQSFSSSGFSGGGGGGTVVFEISGQKLIGVLSNTINANRRLGGTLGLG
jgi:hypothetical protein